MSLEREKPVNEVRITESGRVAVVEECVLCGDTHRHGAGDVALANGDRSTRGAHCMGHRGEYDLVLADDADPPNHWMRKYRRDD